MSTWYALNPDNTVRAVGSLAEASKGLTADRRTVGYTKVGRYLSVSTVFLFGINHSLRDEGSPILFETAIFTRKPRPQHPVRLPSEIRKAVIAGGVRKRFAERGIRLGRAECGVVERYRTWDEAETGHAKYVEEAHARLATMRAKAKRARR